MADAGITLGSNMAISFHRVPSGIDHRYQGDGLPINKARMRRPIVICDNVSECQA